jgi:hypothetical protein
MTDNSPCPAPGNPKKETPKVVLGAGISDYATEELEASIRPMNISPETFAQGIANRTIYVYFYGNIEYSDTINPEAVHHATFCGRYNAQRVTMDACEKHNAID